MTKTIRPRKGRKESKSKEIWKANNANDPNPAETRKSKGRIKEEGTSPWMETD